MATIKNNAIVWDYTDWLGGLHPQAGVGDPILFNGFETAIAFNPFRFLGYASPGELSADVTNVSVVDSALVAMEYVDSTQRGYAIGGTKIHEFNAVSNTLTNNIGSGGDYPRTVTGATMEDIIRYRVSGTDYLFYSWYDGTDGDIGRLTPGTDTFDDDYWTAVASGAALKKDVSHPMIVGDDDILYIGNGNVLVSLDGATANDNALTLPSQYEIKSFAKLNNRTLVIFASTNELTTTSTGNVKAFFWDYVNDDPYKIYDIMGSKAGGAFNFKGSVGVFTIGLSDDPGSNTRNVHLSIFNGSRFEKINSIEAQTEPSHRGVEVIGEVVYANIEGGVFTFGSPFSGVRTGIQEIARGTGTTQGLLKTIASGKQLLSTGTTTSGGLQVLNGGYDTSALKTSFATPFYKVGSEGKLTKVRVEFKDSVTGGRSLQLQLLDRDGNIVAQPISDLRTVEDKKTIKEYTLNSSGTQFSTFDALQLLLEWQTGSGSTEAPIIKRVIAYYEETNTLI